MPRIECSTLRIAKKFSDVGIWLYRTKKMIASSIRLNKLTDNLLHIPVWWIQLPLLLGFGLLALQFFINLLDRIVALRAGEGLSE